MRYAILEGSQCSLGNVLVAALGWFSLATAPSV